MIKLDQILEIKERYRYGESINSIAKDMHIDWKTASSYARKDDFNDTVEAHAKRRRQSKLDPYKGEIDRLLASVENSHYESVRNSHYESVENNHFQSEENSQFQSKKNKDI